MRGFRIEEGVPWVGDRSFPWAMEVRFADHLLKHEDLEHEDVVFRRRGFHLRFENGWLLSVQWGSGNYCANRDLLGAPEWMEDCPDAEIAAWWGDDTHRMVVWENSGDTVNGWQTAEEVLAWIEGFSTLASPPRDGTQTMVGWAR